MSTLSTILSADSPTTFAHRVHRWRKVFVALAALLALGCFLVEDHPWYEGLRIRPYVMALGWVLLSTGVAFRLWSTTHISGNKNKSVVQGGPYALTRNPLYFGSFLAVLGICVLSESIVASAAGLIPLLFTYLLTIRHEEVKLLKLFGDDYSRYLQEVPRFLPSMRRMAVVLADTTHSVNYRDWKRELGTGFGFMMFGVIVASSEELMEYIHTQGWLPVLISF